MATTEHKLIVVGHIGVGKTSLIHRIATGSFPKIAAKSTLCTEKYRKTIINASTGDSVNLVLWDTVGQERFRSLTHNFYRDAAVVLVAVDPAPDLDYKTSEIFKDINFQLFSTNNNQPLGKKSQDTLVFLVLTKTDDCPLARRQEVLGQVEVMARKEAIPIAGSISVSAKTGDNMDLLIKTVVEKVGKERRAGTMDKPRESITLAGKTKTGKDQTKGRFSC